MTRQSQVQAAYDQLRGAILDGSLEQGHELNERTLADKISISRTPVREAIARLTNDGLAERHGCRSRVKLWDDERVGQLYEIRTLLESEACRLAARRRSTNSILRLESVLLEQRELDDNSLFIRRDINYKFHEEIWRASGNNLLLEANQKYGVQSMSIAPTTLRTDERWEQSIEEHSGLLRHISGHQPEEAAELMRSHLQSALHLR